MRSLLRSIFHSFTPPSRRSLHGAIPLTDPTDVSDVQKEVTAYDEEVWIWIYKMVTAMSFVFLVLNIFRVALIHTYNNYWWIAGAAVVLFVLFFGLFLFEAVRLKLPFPKRKRQRLPKVGVLLTVFLNIIAVEIYVGKVAVPDARKKVWSTSTEAFESLPPPAMSVAGDTRFPDRAILTSDVIQLAQLEHNMTSNPNFPNQRAFWHYSGLEELYWTYVIFNGGYPNLIGNGDLYVAKDFYYNSGFGTGRSTLAFAAFDPKFASSNETFQLAGECGVFSGDLFPAIGVTQVTVEQINIVDEVHAVNFAGECDRPEFRKYTRFRPSIVWIEEPVNGGPCFVDGVTPPSNPNDPAPCRGAIDVHFSSMVVTTQTSHYGNSIVGIFTDEGGIIGGIMFITWFFGIVLM